MKTKHCFKRTGAFCSKNYLSLALVLVLTLGIFDYSDASLIKSRKVEGCMLDDKNRDRCDYVSSYDGLILTRIRCNGVGLTHCPKSVNNANWSGDVNEDFESLSLYADDQINSGNLSGNETHNMDSGTYYLFWNATIDGDGIIHSEIEIEQKEE